MFSHSRDEMGTDMGILYLVKQIMKRVSEQAVKVQTRGLIPLLKLRRSNSVVLQASISEGFFVLTLLRTLKGRKVQNFEVKCLAA